MTVVQQLWFYFFTTLKSRLDVDSDDKAAVHKPFKCDAALKYFKKALISVGQIFYESQQGDHEGWYLTPLRRKI